MYIAVIFGIIPFLFGTFYDFSVFFVSAIVSTILLIIFIKNKKLQIKINNAFILSIILVIFSILTIIWAVDKTSAQAGVLRYLSLLVFSILLMQLSEKNKENILKIIPYSGLAIVLISIILGLFPNLKGIVYSESNRLTGLFQYANTFALYLLIGFIITTNRKINKCTIPTAIILLFGIFMTGSRTTFVLSIIYIIYLSFRKETKNKKLYAIIYFSILLVIGIYVLVTKKLDTIGRIFTISLDSSTLLGRILYWKDGLVLLLQNIFGYGYMGYSYKIYEIQTGMYYTKFVHNDYLQMALDIGIIPLIAFIVILIKSLISKQNTKLNKIILISIMLHMFLEFDLQFIIIFYILIMCLEEKEYKKIEINYSITTDIIILISDFIFIYYGIAYFMNYIGKNDITISMLNNTQAKVELMLETENINNAKKLADEILENNKYEYQAYYIKSMYYLQNKEFDKMVENKKKEISLDKYNPKVYEEYVYMLSQVLQYYAEKENQEMTQKYAGYILEVENMVEDVKSKTSTLANKLQDSSEIKLNEETVEYINEIRSIMGLRDGP